MTQVSLGFPQCNAK